MTTTPLPSVAVADHIGHRLHYIEDAIVTYSATFDGKTMKVGKTIEHDTRDYHVWCETCICEVVYHYEDGETEFLQ